MSELLEQPQGLFDADGQTLSATEVEEQKKLLAGKIAAAESDTESRALSKVERRIVKKPNICKQCAENNDPQRVPVHPHCDCDVITDGIDTGVADPDSRFLSVLDPDSIEMQIISGALDSAGIQLEPGSVSIMEADNVRFSDFARWLEQVQPYLDAGSQYVSIVVDDDTDEAVAQIEETVSIVAEDSDQLIEAIQNKKLWFSIAKAVAF